MYAFICMNARRKLDKFLLVALRYVKKVGAFWKLDGSHLKKRLAPFGGDDRQRTTELGRRFLMTERTFIYRLHASDASEGGP